MTSICFSLWLKFKQKFTIFHRKNPARSSYSSCSLYLNNVTCGHQIKFSNIFYSCRYSPILNLTILFRMWNKHGNIKSEWQYNEPLVLSLLFDAAYYFWQNPNWNDHNIVVWVCSVFMYKFLSDFVLSNCSVNAIWIIFAIMYDDL